MKHVDVADAAAFNTLTVRLKRDDGAAVYVNGVEVVRDNLPAGTLTASTAASSFTSGTGETSWFEYTVPASLLTDGDNTIAVELHQATAANADGIFDLELVAHGSIETVAPTAPTVTVGTATFSAVPLTWTAATDATGVAGYLVRRDGTPIAFTTATSFVDTGLAPGTTYNYAVTALDTSGQRLPARHRCGDHGQQPRARAARATRGRTAPTAPTSAPHGASPPTTPPPGRAARRSSDGATVASPR